MNGLWEGSTVVGFDVGPALGNFVAREGWRVGLAVGATVGLADEGTVDETRLGIREGADEVVFVGLEEDRIITMAKK